jgi:hypothetical protein
MLSWKSCRQLCWQIGTLYVLDYLNDDPRVRKLSPDGLVTTVADTSIRQ